MKAARPIDFADVASRVSLRSLIEADCGPPGRSRKYRCPFHADTNPSLGITPDGKHWKCWACDAKGDALDWIARQDGCTIAEAARKLDPSLARPGDQPRKPKPTPPPPSKPKPSAPWQDPAWQAAVDALVARAERSLWGRMGRDALEWLRGRGLDDHTITRFRLGFLPEAGWTSPVPRPDGTTAGIHHERGILIPWLAPGGWYAASSDPEGPRWCGANVRRLMPDADEPWSGPDKCKALRGSERGRFYPWPDLLPTQPDLPALILEGEIDALIATQEAGWIAHAGTVGGATQRPHETALEVLAACPRWLIATDHDRPGDEAARWFAAADPRKARRAFLPSGKDLGDFALSGGDVAAWLEGELARIGI